MSLLDRYIIREMGMPLLFGIAAFMSIFVGTDLLNLAGLVVEYGAPVGAVGKMFMLRLPQIAVWTFPMAVLMATLLSLSRLSANSEIVAMQAGGCSFYRLIAPVLIIGALMGFLTFGINELVVPAANSEYERVMYEEVRGQQLPTVTRNVILKKYKSNALSWFLYASRYEGRERILYDVTMVSLQEGRPRTTTYADRVVWAGNQWLMENGVVYSYGGDGAVVSMVFADSRQPAGIQQKPKDIARQKSPEEMTTRELAQQIEILRSQGADVKEYQTQYYLKYSLPTACLIFALVGAPLGVQPHRSASATGFGLSIVIVFVYYVVMTVGTAFGQGGQVPPVVGAWLANAILGLAGALLLYKQSR